MVTCRRLEGTFWTFDVSKVVEHNDRPRRCHRPLAEHERASLLAVQGRVNGQESRAYPACSSQHTLN